MLCSRDDFGIFENFEITKDSFAKEQKITIELQRMRSQLRGSFEKILDSSNNLKSKSIHAYFENYDPINVKCVNRACIYLELKKLFFHQTYINLHVLFGHRNKQFHDFLDEIGYNYTAKLQNIIDGALKGLIILQETYNLDIHDFVKGLAANENSISREIDSLRPDDLANMSSVALNVFQWYDNSLIYLKAALDVFYNISKSEQKPILPKKNLEKTLITMKNTYPIAHNEMLYRCDWS